MKNLTIEDLYHPFLEKIYSTISIICFTFSTIAAPLMIFLIITKSTKTMSNYKMLLINQVLWAYAFNLVATFWQPVVLTPFGIAYPAGPAKYLAGDSFYKCFITYVICGSGVGHSIIISFTFRIVQLQHSPFINKIYSTKIIIYPARIFTLISSLLIFIREF